MRSKRFHLAVAGTAIALFTFTGCSEEPSKGVKITDGPPEIAHMDHAEEGPHHGQLIELGQDEYHAELVHDDATHTTTIYLLDGAATSAVPIDAKELMLNLIIDGKPQQFALVARAEPNDPPGRSSCFTTDSEALDAKGTTGRLNVQIQNKAFVGKIEQHDHAGHKH